MTYKTYKFIQTLSVALLSWAGMSSPQCVAWSQQITVKSSAIVSKTFALEGSITPSVTLSDSGGDIGAQVNVAVASFAGGGGSIYIPAKAGCYIYTTPIVLGDKVKLFGSSEGGTCLQYTGTSGSAVTILSLDTLAELTLAGTSGASTAVGLTVSGRDDLTDHVTIGLPSAKFHLGITFTDNTYLDRFVNVSVGYNDQNMYFPSGFLNAGENMSFVGGAFANGGTFANCVQLGSRGVLNNAEFRFDNVSFDLCQLVNNEGMVQGSGVHFEDLGVADAHPFMTTYASNLDSMQGVRAGTILSGSTIFTDGQTSGSAFFEVDKYGSLELDGLIDTYNVTAIPLVQLGSSANEAPYFRFTDAQNARTQAQMYSIAPGVRAFLNIDTPNVSQHTTAGNHVFANNSISVPYGQGSAVVLNGPAIGTYEWTGTGSTWFGEQLQPDNRGGGFNVCGAGAFSFAGYGAMGSEPEVCATHLGFNSLTSLAVNSASGYQIGGSYGSKGDCMISQGTGSSWGPCPGQSPALGSYTQPGVLQCGAGITCINGVISLNTGVPCRLCSNPLTQARTATASPVRAALAPSTVDDAGLASAIGPISHLNWLPAAICSGGLASRGDLSTYTNHAPKLGCYAPDTSTAAYMAFEAQPGNPQYASATFATPPNWTGSDLSLVFAGTAPSGYVTWTIQAGCSNADDLFSNVAYGVGTDSMAPVSTTTGGVVRTKPLSDFVAPGANGCVAGSLVTYRIFRSRTDTQAGDAHLLGVVLTTRTSQ